MSRLGPATVVPAVLLAVVLGVVLGGCQGDPEPRFVEPTESVSASPSESPSPSPSSTRTSVPPANMSPEETARAWVRAQNALLLRGEARAFRDLMHPDCSSCRNLFLSPILETYRKGGRYETHGWSVLRIRSGETKSGNPAVVVVVRIPGGRTFDSASAAPVDYQTSKRPVYLELARYQGHLTVLRVVVP